MPPTHGHSHGGVACHGHSHSHGDHSQPDVIDDPTLLEDVDSTTATADAGDRERSDGWEDILGSGSLLLKRVNATATADQDAEQRQASRPRKGQEVTVAVKLVQLPSTDKDADTKEDFDNSTEFTAPNDEDDGVLHESSESVQGRIGEGDFITAIDMALQLMAPGEEVALRAQARHCFADYGNGVFPPGTDLYIELKLLSVGELRVEPHSMAPEALQADINAFNEKGNQAMALKDYQKALSMYTAGAKYVVFAFDYSL